MSRPIVVGLLGRAGSGKSTAAEYICTHYTAKRVSFASPLKELAKTLWNFSDEQVYGSQAVKEAVDPRWGISPRTAMIRLGDGGRNALGKNIWVRACFDKILEDFEQYQSRLRENNEVDAYQIYVIEDVRYPNEATQIINNPKFDGFVVKLVCPDSDSSSVYASAPSEMSVDEVDEAFITTTVVSHKSPDALDLKSKIDDAMRMIVQCADGFVGVK